MAHFFGGSTKCALCEHVIDDSPRGFPAFLPKGHELWRFSDACFHESCYVEWSQRERMETLHSRFREMWDRRPVHLGMEDVEAWLIAESRKFDEFAMNH